MSSNDSAIAGYTGAAPHPAAAAATTNDFLSDGLPHYFLRQLIDENGGEAAFEGMTTSNVKRNIIVPTTQASKLSLCAQMRQEGDARVQVATWFISHPWQIQFLDLVRALEAFFADKPGAVIWIDLVYLFPPASTPRSRSLLSGGSRRFAMLSVEWGRWSW